MTEDHWLLKVTLGRLCDEVLQLFETRVAKLEVAAVLQDVVELIRSQEIVVMLISVKLSRMVFLNNHHDCV